MANDPGIWPELSEARDGPTIAALHLFSQVAIIQLQRPFCARVVVAVKPPVACDDVHFAVDVEVSSGNAYPPAGELIEG